MAGIKISALPAVVTAAFADTFPVVQGGITKKETLTQALGLVGQQDILMYPNISIKSTTGNLDTYNFQAYDVDDAVYRTFMSLRSSNTPRLLIAAPTSGLVAFANFGGTFTIDGATINSSPIGITTPDAAKFTTVSITDDTTISNGKAIKTGTGLGNGFVLQAYDVDGVAYKDFITLTANNTPSCAISKPSGGQLTIDGASLGGNAPIQISQATSITTNALTVNGDASVTGTTTLKATYGYRPIVAVASTSKTFGLSDANTFQDSQSGSTTTFTVPANASVAFPTGTEIEVYQQGAGQVVFVEDVGVTIQSLLGNKKIGGQYSGAILKQISTDVWTLIGNLVP